MGGGVLCTTRPFPSNARLYLRITVTRRTRKVEAGRAWYREATDRLGIEFMDIEGALTTVVLFRG